VPAAAQDGAAHLVIISGLSGEERFARDYLSWGVQLLEAAESRLDVPAANIVWLAEDADAHAAIRARSTKADIERELRALAARAGANDRVLILIFGHGSYQSGESRISLPGPDITSRELDVLLDGLGSRRIAIVNTTSSSGGFITDLAAPNRIVITATKSPMEANETIFGRHFIAALTGDAADTDESGRVSLMEAFEYARIEVEREYQRERKLQSEHALIDALGDGRGITELSDSTPHARIARTFYLASAIPTAANESPELRALYEEKARIEAALEALRARRESMPQAEYDAELERLLLELARNGQAIRRLEGGGS